MGVALLLGIELLDGCEDHAASVHREQLAQVGAIPGLHGRLAEQVLAAGKDTEELVVQVVAVGEHNDGGVLHRRLADDGTGVEGHGEALAGALGVPDDADARVADVAARSSPSLVASGFHSGPLQICRAKRLVYSYSNGVELVVAGHLLGKRAAVVLEHDEVAQEGEEAAWLEDALQHHLQLGQVCGGQRLSGDGAPGLEPLPAGGEGAEAGLDSVRDHQCLVHGEQGWKFGLVGLELVPGRADGGVFVGRVLEFNEAEGRPLTKRTMSGRRVLRFSVTVNWLTASQSLLSVFSKSMTRT